MRQQGVQYVHFSGDHGRIKGQDSLVKGWSYAAWDKNGNRFVDFLCSDIDKCGHSAKEVVVGIKKSFQRIKMLVPLAKCVSSEGDAGGGGYVQSTFGPLRMAEVLVDWARYINCLMHALSKCLQRACEDVFGKQGMGQNSCLQMIFFHCESVQALERGGRD